MPLEISIDHIRELGACRQGQAGFLRAFRRLARAETLEEALALVEPVAHHVMWDWAAVHMLNNYEARRRVDEILWNFEAPQDLSDERDQITDHINEQYVLRAEVNSKVSSFLDDFLAAPVEEAHQHLIDNGNSGSVVKDSVRLSLEISNLIDSLAHQAQAIDRKIAELRRSAMAKQFVTELWNQQHGERPLHLPETHRPADADELTTIEEEYREAA